MTLEHNRHLLDFAMNSGLIDIEQYNDAMDTWSKNRSKDGGFILLEKGFLTAKQYDDLLVQSGEISGVSFKHFSVEGVIGRGGSGCVYMARDEKIGRPVAIKEINPQKLTRNPKRTVARFLREAKINGRLDHPGIVPVYELGRKDDGSYFYVMKYIKGITFLEAVAECSADDAEEYFAKRFLLIDKFIGIVEAMAFAHSKEIIHRDLKPGNIVIGEFGEVIILDWGLAKSLSENEIEESLEESLSEENERPLDDGLTHVGAKLGTPAYMSPEQIDPSFGNVDRQSDVYSLGVLLYLLLTGEKPYSGNAQEVMKAISSPDDPPSPLDLCPQIPRELSAICEKAMQKRKDARFQDANEMARELKSYRNGKLLSFYSYSKSELLRRFIRQNKTAVIASFAVLFSIVVGAGFSIHYAIDANRQRAVAENALIDVTGLSESTMKLAAKIASDLDRRAKSIAEDLGDIAEDAVVLHLMKTGEFDEMLGYFSKKSAISDVDFAMMRDGNLLRKSSSKMTYSIESASDYSALLSRFKLEGSVINRLHFDEEKRRYELRISVPVFDARSIGGIFTAILPIDDFISESTGFDPRENSYQIWLMDMSGNLIYDENPDEAGRKLFSDRIYASFPELQKFGKSMLAEPWGVGHYNFKRGEKSSHLYKVAAWDTAEIIPSEPLRVVVTYPYQGRQDQFRP
jgi:serine/threonine-protein kinase